jgi:type I restriction enzyme S subunit
LKKGTVIDDGIQYVPDEVLVHIKNYTVCKGDVYITNVGACIGDCGVIPEKYDGANLTENAVKMTNLRGCESQYLAYYLSSNHVQQLIKTLIASATLGKLSIANIKNIEINLPPVAEQIEIIRIVDELFEKENLLENAIDNVITQIDLMKKSILAKAFRGELGTNNPEEESSIELLKDILR